MTRDAIELLRDERDRAIEALRQIEEEGVTWHKASRDLPVRDVTAKQANRQRQIIERMDRLIRCSRRRTRARELNRPPLRIREIDTFLFPGAGRGPDFLVWDWTPAFAGEHESRSVYAVR